MNETINPIIENCKDLQALVDITNYLKEHNFTYNQADDFIKMLQEHLTTSRQECEYETCTDYFNHNKCHDLKDTVVFAPPKMNVAYEMVKTARELQRELGIG